MATTPQTTSSAATGPRTTTSRATRYNRWDGARRLAQAAADTINGRTDGPASYWPEAPALEVLVREAAEALHRAGRAVEVYPLTDAECRKQRRPPGTLEQCITLHPCPADRLSYFDAWDDGAGCFHVRAFGMWGEVYHCPREEAAQDA
jgi:hypothetical protein